MEILSVFDESFKEYGKIWDDIDIASLMEEMEHTNTPKDDVIYVARDEELQGTEAMPQIRDRIFGGLPIQMGYCNGNNKKLNAIEYHRNSEVDIAETDMVLLIGKLQDVTSEFKYDTSKIEAFYVPKNTVVEIYETTLHYAPCTVAGGEIFRAVIALPEGTNTDIDFKLDGNGEDILMTAKNKWLIAHPDAKIDGAYNGLIGKNITID
ncbi:MAG: DUF4867 family protein [Lachnospiraceae bacterium]|jgi:hypothetical protein|nr:DUF4867 family protein [Lachnospiraceae bacterium]